MDSAPVRASSGDKLYYTTKEVQELHIPCSFDPPPPIVCEFCGKENYRVGILFCGRIIGWNLVDTPRCDCSQASAFWSQVDKDTSERETREAAEQRRRDFIRRIHRSGIAEESMHRSFKTFRVDGINTAQKIAFETAYAYAKSFETHKKDGTGLYFEGTNGTGKTHLATAIAIKLIHSGYKVICKSSSQMFSDIRNTYNHNEDKTEAEVLDFYKCAELLVIDDLGKENVTAWTTSTLFDIISERNERKKPMIVTTNYGDNELMCRLAPKIDGDIWTAKSIISRLHERCKAVTMVWDDFREKTDV